MAVEYQNRKGDVYRLFLGKTRTGKPNYYMAKRTRVKAAPVDEVPEGFEIYEDPATSRVVLRRIVEHKTTEEERAFIEQAIRKMTSLKYFQVERAGDALIVYLSDHNEDAFPSNSMVRAFGLKALDYLAQTSTYSPVMGFVLKDEVQRLFTIQRWCSRGSIDGWIFLKGPAPLAQQAAHYLPHLGKESFFELM